MRSIDLGLLDDDLSSAMGTETLLAHDLILDGLPASRRGLMHHIGGTRCLVLSVTDWFDLLIGNPIAGALLKGGSYVGLQVFSGACVGLLW
jgi:hypothetical protein